MKITLLQALFITNTLIISGCSIGERPNNTKVASDNMNHQNHDQIVVNEQKEHSHSHEQHQDNSPSNTQAKLTTPKNIAANQATNLVINIQDAGGKPVTKFDTFQEQNMHLIMVNDDLTFFQHLHPDYKNNGKFEVSAEFPNPGNYVLFSDYKPTGQPERVSILNLNVPGSIPLPKDLEKFTKSKTLSNTKVTLNTSPSNLRVGQEIKIGFDIKDRQSNQAVQDIKPYLGEKGHLVIIKSSSPLTKSDYIHAHALKNSPPGKVEFMTKFPHKGTYKMWMQFNFKGKVETADFWVSVES
ncbi:hypothetical protein B6N60_00779 [Richelia sinica FACHB-800]|uniref:Uncharacterized protein n=1 Tax=Richelia sinica FACHB-800 TaxID=1357546 RepID=A0A975T4S4_9NOST|nr:hypothetical protein [Richelia sinica]MBD2663215.1 hypothetical protein [Richelia sinica FACHB-800]QXE22099.1 hypothetical protein B6N60_00779 [Richelia sinica FACHB-800]